MTDTTANSRRQAAEQIRTMDEEVYWHHWGRRIMNEAATTRELEDWIAFEVKFLPEAWWGSEGKAEESVFLGVSMPAGDSDYLVRVFEDRFDYWLLFRAQWSSTQLHKSREKLASCLENES